MAQLNYNDFATQVKKKLPEYASMDNLSLARKMEEEYPQYKGKIAYPEKLKTSQFKGNPNQYMSPAKPQQLQTSANPEAYMSKLQGNPNDINAKIGAASVINSARQPIQDLVDQATMPVKSASQLKFEAAMSNQSPAQYTRNFNANKMVEDELARRAAIKQNNVVESELRKNPVTPMGTAVDTALAVPKGAIRGMSTSAAQGIGVLEQMIPIQAVQEHGKSITDFYENAYNNPNSLLYKTLGVPMKYQQGGLFDNPANAFVNMGSMTGEIAPILLSGAIGGKAATKAAQKMLPSITEKGLQNAGSLGSFAGSMIASMPQYAQESYLQNKQDLERQLGRPLNQDENNKLVASSLGTIGINSALNAIPVMHGLNRFNPAQVANKGFKAGAKNALAQMFEEGATEAGEQTANELQKAYLGNSEGYQQALKNIGESGLAGGILGGIFGAGGNVVANAGKTQQPANPQEAQQLIQMMDAVKQQEVQPTAQVTDQVSEQAPEEEKKQVSAEIVGENAKYNPEPTQEDTNDQIADTSKMVEEPVEEDEIAREIQEEFEQNSKSDIGVEKDIIYPDDKTTDRWGSIINTEENQEEQYEPNEEQTDWENEETIESHRQFKDAENKQILPEDLDNSLKDKKTANQKLIQLYNEAQDKDETSPEFQRYLDFQNKYNETFGKTKKLEGYNNNLEPVQESTPIKNIVSEAKTLYKQNKTIKGNVSKDTSKAIIKATKIINLARRIPNNAKGSQEYNKVVNQINKLYSEMKSATERTQEINSEQQEMPVKPTKNENRINNTYKEKTLENAPVSPTENENSAQNKNEDENKVINDNEQKIFEDDYITAKFDKNKKIKLNINKELKNRASEKVAPVTLKEHILTTDSNSKNDIANEIKTKLFGGTSKDITPIEATNMHTGQTVKINASTVNESAKELLKGADKNLVATVLLNSKDIFESSELIFSNEEAKRQGLENDQTVYRYANLINYKGENYVAISTVFDNHKEQQIKIYHIAGYKNGTNTRHRYMPDVSTINSISDLVNFVKGKVVQDFNNVDTQTQFKETKSSAEHAHIRDRITKLAQERRGVIDKGNYEASIAINKVTGKSKEIAKKYKTNEVTVRELMTFLRECDESNISNAKKLLPKQSGKTDKFDYRALYRLHNKLSQKDLLDLKHTIDNASNELEQQWEQYKEYKDAYFEDKSEIGNVSNYILHSWDKPKTKTEPIVGKRISKTSQSEKNRIFKTYKQGIDYVGENGEVVIPNTLDAAELLKMHSKDVMTKIANGKFAKILGNNVIAPNTDNGKIISYSYNPEFKKPLEAVLGSETQDVKEPTKARQAYRKVNNLFKRYAINIGSLFHHSTLSESRNSFGKGIAAILPVNAIKTQFNAAYKALKGFTNVATGNKNNDVQEIYKRIPEAKEALKYGVKLGVTNDLDIESARKELKKAFGKIAGVKLNEFSEVADNALWDSLANTYKIDTFNDLVDTYTKYYADKKKGELPEVVKRELAQFVNDSFGGQNYDTLQIKDEAIKRANEALLSTDWTLSTMIRQSASILSSEKMQRWLNKVGESSKAGYELKELARKIGIGSFTNDIEAAGIRGKAARIMFAKALIQAQVRAAFVTGTSLIIKSLLAKSAGDDEEELEGNEIFNYNNQFDREFLNYLFPDYFIGRDDKKIYDEDGEETGEVEHNAGKEMYVKQGKQFKEIPELVQGGLQYFGWNLMDRIASKMSPLISGLATKGAGTLADKYGDEFVKNKYGWKKDIKKRIPYTNFEYDSAIPLGMPFALNNIDKKSSKANKLVASIYSGVKEPNSYQASDEIMKKLMKGDSNIQTEEFSRRLRRNGLKDTDSAYDRMIKIAVREALENKNSRVNTNGDVRRRFFKALRDYGFDDYDIEEFKDGNYNIYGED